MGSSAERKLRAATSSISRIKSQIASLNATIDRRANPSKFGLSTQSRKSSGLIRARTALQFNLNVEQGRAATAFQEVVREKTVKAQARIKAQQVQAEKQRKAEIARQKQAEANRQKKLVADSQAQKQRDRDAEARRKQAEIVKAQAVFQSEDIQQDVKPAFESGEESTIANLEQVRLDRLEKLEATKSIPRLEEGTTFFGTGAGFEPVDIDSGKGAGASRTEGTAFTVKKGEVTSKPIKNILDPGSSEGAFIDTQVQVQLAGNVEDLLVVEKGISALKTGKASKAASVFEQTVTPQIAESGAFGGSTFLISAQEAGLAINRPSEGFPAISGQLIGETLAPGDFADIVNADFKPGGTAFKVKGGKVTSQPILPIDKFELATSEIEATGFKAGEPISNLNLFGFESSPKKKSTPITSQVFPPSFGSGGLGPLNQPRKPQNTVKSIIDAGFAPTQRPIERGIIPFDQPISSLGKVGKKPPRNIPLLIGGVQTTPKLISSFESNFGSFVTDIGSNFGFDIGGDFFSSLSKSISFERSSSKKKIGKKSLALFRAEQAKLELSKKKKRAKAAGFSVGSKGKVFKFGKVNGRTVILAEGKTVKGLQASIKAKAKAKADFARNKAAIQKAVAINKARKKAKSRARAKSREKRKVQKSRTRSRTLSGTSKPRKVVKVSKPSARKRSSDRSQDFLSGLTSSPGTDRFSGGPSGSKKKSKKGKSTPGIFGGGFGRRF